MTESPKKVTEEQSSTSPPCTEGTEGHKKRYEGRAVAYCPWDGQHAARMRSEGRIVAGRSRDSQDAARMRHGRAIAQDMGRAGRAGNQTCRAVPLMVPWDGQDASGRVQFTRVSVGRTRDRQTWDGRSTRSAGCTWVTGRLLPALKGAIPNAAGTCTWFVGRSHGNVYRRANWTAKSPGHGRGMGGPWKAHGKCP